MRAAARHRYGKPRRCRGVGRDRLGAKRTRLRRALVGALRDELKAAHATAGPYLRRYSNAKIAVHIMIVASFAVLAATGLPPGFAAAMRAPRPAALRRGLARADVLRRSAAFVPSGYYCNRLRGDASRVVLRRQKGCPRSPRSMVPQPKDARELVAMADRFLYRQWRPQFDRWTGRERFDYLAAFRGIAIIGLTGLVRWFPGAVTRALPDWARDTVLVPQRRRAARHRLHLPAPLLPRAHQAREHFDGSGRVCRPHAARALHGRAPARVPAGTRRAATRGARGAGAEHRAWCAPMVSGSPPSRSASRSRSDSSWRCAVACATDAAHRSANS
jgi:hypothetical protein